MKKTYQGSCHCGKVTFEVDMDLDHVRVCDCSLCRKHGARPRTAPEVWTVNVRCLEDVELDSIPVKHVYGSKLE